MMPIWSVMIFMGDFQEPGVAVAQAHTANHACELVHRKLPEDLKRINRLPGTPRHNLWYDQELSAEQILFTMDTKVVILTGC